MLTWYLIGSVGLFEPDRIHEVKAGRLKVCLSHGDQHWHAFSRKCPHAGASFTSGRVENGKLTCSYHRQQFDLETGKGCEGQGNFIKIFPVKEEQGVLYIAIDESTSFLGKLFPGF